VNTFKFEIAVRMVKPCHAIKAIMASNTLLSEISNMLYYKPLITRRMTCRAGRIEHRKPAVCDMAIRARNPFFVEIQLVPDQTESRQQMIEILHSPQAQIMLSTLVI
jgi:hypothetical protein